MVYSVLRFIARSKQYFDLSHEKDNEALILENIRSGTNFRGSNTWVLIFAIFIASLGLNVNSTAVIIGAMLISPLMGPILGIGFAVGTNDFELLKLSYRNLLAATLISVLTATVYFLITPLSEARSELLARTSPTIYDVLIALFGGAAGVVAVSMKGRGGNVIPGVAIATALMPPLCTAGFGLATGNLGYFLGAFYLFFINTIFICLATFLGVRLMNFTPKAQLDKARYLRVRRTIIIVVVATMIPASIITVGIIRDSIVEGRVNSFIKGELNFAGTHILSNSLDEKTQTLNIVAVGREITDEQQLAVQEKMPLYKLDDYQLHFIQGTQSDTLLAERSRMFGSENAKEKELLANQAAQLKVANEEMERYKRLERLTPQVAQELRPLFPSVRSLALLHSRDTRTDTTLTSATYVLALVSLHQGKELAPASRLSLRKWLKTRIKTDSVQVVIK